jgi:hypothetical protein
MTCEPTIYELAVIHVRPGHLLDFLNIMQKGKDLFEKHGAKTLGVWLSEAGMTGSIVTLKEFPSISARMKARCAMLQEPESQAYFKASGPFIAFARSFICKKPPTCEFKALNPKAPVVIHKIVPKKFKFFAGNHHRSVIEHLSKKVSADIFHHVVSLFPIMYDEFCFFSIFQIGENKVDEAYGAWVSAMRDTKNWAGMSITEDVYTTKLNIMCNPIDFSKIPK